MEIYRITTSIRRNKGNKGGTQRIGGLHQAKCIVLANRNDPGLTVERITGEWENVTEEFLNEMN